MRRMPGEQAVGILLHVAPGRDDIQRDRRIVTRFLKQPMEHDRKRLARIARHSKGGEGCREEWRGRAGTAATCGWTSYFDTPNVARCTHRVTRPNVRPIRPKFHGTVSAKVGPKRPIPGDVEQSCPDVGHFGALCSSGRGGRTSAIPQRYLAV